MTGSVLCLEFRWIKQEILVLFLTFSDLGFLHLHPGPTMVPLKSSKLNPFICCLVLFPLAPGHGSKSHGSWCGQSAFSLFRIFANLRDFLFQSLGLVLKWRTTSQPETANLKDEGAQPNQPRSRHFIEA